MRIDLGISLVGGPKSKDMRYIHITRNDVINRIKNHPSIDLWTKDYLYKKINQYPDNALIYFVNNINEIVISALNERSKVLREQHNEKESSAREDRAVEQQSGISSGAGVAEVEGQEDSEREAFFQRTAG